MHGAQLGGMPLNRWSEWQCRCSAKYHPALAVSEWLHRHIPVQKPHLVLQKYECAVPVLDRLQSNPTGKLSCSDRQGLHWKTALFLHKIAHHWQCETALPIQASGFGFPVRLQRAYLRIRSVLPFAA